MEEDGGVAGWFEVAGAEVRRWTVAGAVVRRRLCGRLRWCVVVAGLRRCGGMKKCGGEEMAVAATMVMEGDGG